MILEGLAQRAAAAVDPDCFDREFGFICHKGRVEDAKVADELVAPVLARAGWVRGCYRVQYVKGDAGRLDVLLVGVDGRRGAMAPGCKQIEPAKLTVAEAREIQRRGGGMQELMKAIGDRTNAKGARESATSAELLEIGKAIKKSILAADTATKSRLLRDTRQISLGSGYGGEATIPLP